MGSESAEKPLGADLGMIELTTPEGAMSWIVVGSIWGIEKNADESFTLVKTAVEPVPVMESPLEIFTRIHEALAGAETPDLSWM